VVQEVPWGRLHEIVPGVWALVSTPLEDQTTLCNGGIVAGTDGVFVVEAFGSPRGLQWMAEQARALTGRWPDHVLVTHYHGDHSNGLPAAGEGEWSATTHATGAARDQAMATAMDRGSAGLRAALERVTLLPVDTRTRLDLGGRSVTLHPVDGHTASDTWVQVDDPGVVFCGDLVWNQFFPNYVDARPDRLREAVARIPHEEGMVLVPGHGPLADRAAYGRYTDLLDQVESHARIAATAGWDAAEAAERFEPSGPAAEWFRFSPAYPERALGRWLDLLGNG
jgi:glyoxylase-like metal-dependent hydrolase (beta-lactamase superfamily II)